MVDFKYLKLKFITLVIIIIEFLGADCYDFGFGKSGAFESSDSFGGFVFGLVAFKLLL